ncbi:MAG: hypothetical protein ACJ76P_08640 [Actinomycetota bacterium]
MNRRRWTIVGVVGGTFAAAAGVHYWYRKRRDRNDAERPYPGMWQLTKEVAESIDAGKRALREQEEGGIAANGREEPEPPLD